MDLDDALQTFIEESRELLEGMETALLDVEQATEKDERINAIFRTAHTIKGSAGLFNLEQIVEFTHVMESVLDRVRSGKQSIDGELVSLLLACGDHIAAMVDEVAAGHTKGSDELGEAGLPLINRLHRYLPDAAMPTAVSPVPIAAAQRAVTESDPVRRLNASEAGNDHWHISVRFGTGVLRNGMEPIAFIRYLGTLGQVVSVVTLTDALPAVSEMDPECCYLGFEIALKADVEKSEIERAFEFVLDDCTLVILPPHSMVRAYIEQLQQHVGDMHRLGDLLLACGTLTRQELDTALHVQSSEGSEKPLGTILLEQGSVQPEVVEAALTKQRQIKEAAATESRSIRVDADKLDQLINLVGELIIAGANVNQMAQRARVSELQESTSKLSMLVEEVRDSALQLRMVKIGATFNRFQRVVHDVSRELGKDVVLVVNGEDTELDKTVVEKIGDPLMHLVRNSLDHGIESVDVRAARGKPAQGTLHLNAFHDSGSIVITVQDDGGGLRREKILKKAIERGLIESGQNLSDAEVFALIFEPGFSTAETVTNLSGRGVGMDVVKRNIDALRGTVEVASEEGVGTTVTVRLPLTLAIIDGFLVGVGQLVYAIPLDMIEECVAYTAEPDHDYTNLRGQVLPFIRLRQLFNIRGAPAKGENIVVLRHGSQKAGLVVDTLMGEFQTVIKPLGPMFDQVRCVSGSTILGSGEVGLILDVPALVRQASEHAGAAAGSSVRLH